MAIVDKICFHSHDVGPFSDRESLRTKGLSSVTKVLLDFGRIGRWLVDDDGVLPTPSIV